VEIAAWAVWHPPVACDDDDDYMVLCQLERDHDGPHRVEWDNERKVAPVSAKKAQTPLEVVQAELAKAMIPWPDDYLEDLSPGAVLLLLRQMAMASMKAVVGASLSLGEGPDEHNDTVADICNGVAAAIVGATHALVALELLPPEAEEALEA